MPWHKKRPKLFTADGSHMGRMFLSRGGSRGVAAWIGVVVVGIGPVVEAGGRGGGGRGGRERVAKSSWRKK